MYKYSVIMPVYNSEHSLSKSIESVISQSYKNWELIAVNDGSCDNSEMILKKYADTDPRIIMVNQNNAGPGAARNTAIAHSAGDYIAFLDSDDYWENDFLELVNKEIEGKNQDIIFIEMINERVDGTVINIGNTYSFRNCSKFDLICNQMTGNMSWGMGKVIGRRLISENANRFSNLQVGEEAIFSFDILNNAKTYAFIEKPLYHYIQSTTGQHTKGDMDPWSRVVGAMKKHLQEIGVYEQFEKNVNSFAMRALSISIYRNCCANSRTTAVKLIKSKYKEYSDNYSLSNYNKKSVDKGTTLVIFLLKMKMFSIVWLAANYRMKKRYKQ